MARVFWIFILLVGTLSSLLSFADPCGGKGPLAPFYDQASQLFGSPASVQKYIKNETFTLDGRNPEEWRLAIALITWMSANSQLDVLGSFQNYGFHRLVLNIPQIEQVTTISLERSDSRYNLENNYGRGSKTISRGTHSKDLFFEVFQGFLSHAENMLQDFIGASELPLDVLDSLPKTTRWDLYASLGFVFSPHSQNRYWQLDVKKSFTEKRKQMKRILTALNRHGLKLELAHGNARVVGKHHDKVYVWIDGFYLGKGFDFEFDALERELISKNLLQIN